MSRFTALSKNNEEFEIFEQYIGRYVIIRSRNEGVNAGFLEKANKDGVVLNKARRLWRHRPSDTDLSWYEGVAESGLSDDSRVSSEVTKVIVEDYSITLCTEKARESIIGFVTNKQS
jgi:hypothetical protein